MYGVLRFYSETQTLAERKKKQRERRNTVYEEEVTWQRVVVAATPVPIKGDH